MTALDCFVNITLSVVLIIGSYQFYFWCQRNYRSKPRQLLCRLDKHIPRRASWVWIYSGLYYPAIIWTAMTTKTMRLFNYTAFSYMLLLVAQMLFFLLLPVAVPDQWRVWGPARTLSERFLKLIQRVDGSGNCFPSMHISVATLTALHLRMNSPDLGNWSFAFPILIGVSALFTKQHYLYDLPAGALLGWLTFATFQAIY